MKVKIFWLLLFISISIYCQNVPYVILISFDGFRWDYSERSITPNLDKMKKDGVHAFSLKPAFPTKTFPNHYSIVSGMHPQNHGIIFNSFTNPVSKKRYRTGNSKEVKNSEWYLGEAFWETAKRNGIITASYFWPGSEMDLEFRRPDYFENYEHNRPYKKRIDGVIEWLKIPPKKRPHFITLYFHDTDTYGHGFGPNSEEVNESIKRLDSLIGYLNVKLAQINLIDSTNIILVSDHGMTEISLDKVINIEELLSEFKVQIDGSKPVMMIKPNKDEFEDVYLKLKKNENHFRVYKKNELPKYFHFDSNPFIFPIILVADIGWSLVTKKWYDSMKKNYSRGNHGYENNHTDMHGVFIACGPNFKSDYTTGTLLNLDINPLLCKIFNIKPLSNIDGKIERIEFILK